MPDKFADTPGRSSFVQLSLSQKTRALWNGLQGYRYPQELRWTVLQIAGLWLLAVAVIWGLFRSLNLPAADFLVIAWQPAHQLRATGALDPHYPYPLWTPLLMFPFTFGSVASDALSWLLFNLLLVAVGVAGLVRLLRWSPHPLVLALLTSLLLVYRPMVTALTLGQTVLIQFVVQVLVCLALRRHHWKTVGMLLGITLVKPHVLLLMTVGVLGWAVWHRRWQIVLGFAAVLLSFIGLAAPFAGSVGQVIGGGIGEHLQTYIGIGSTLWGVSLTLAPSLWQLPVVISAVLLAGLVWLWLPTLHQQDVPERLLFLVAVTCVVNLSVVPYSWSYNQVLLIYPICYAIERSRCCGRTTCIAWSAAIIVLIFPVTSWIGQSFVVPNRSDAYYAIPLLLFLPLLCAIEWQALRGRRRRVHDSDAISSAIGIRSYVD